MIDEKKELNLRPKKKMSRRDFLKLGGTVVVGGLLGARSMVPPGASGEVIESVRRLFESQTVRELRAWGLGEKNPELMKYLVDHPEAIKQIDLIKSYREKIGLRNVPDEVLNYKPVEAEASWKSTENVFSNELPESMSKAVETVRSILEIVYGSEIYKTIRRIIPGSGTYFIRGENDRSLGFPLFYDLNFASFLQVILHESTHAVDPGLYANYPPEMFFLLEVAKWRMLSRSFSVEGLYLDRPEDRVAQRVAYDLGKRTVLELLLNKDFHKLEGAERIMSLVETTKKEVGFQSGKYTKRFIFELGKKLVATLRGGNNYFFQEDYEKRLTDGLIEVYADQVTWSLLPVVEAESVGSDWGQWARSTQSDEEIKNGVEATLAARRGEPVVGLEEVRDRLSTLLTRLRSELVRQVEPQQAGPQQAAPVETLIGQAPPSEREVVEEEMLKLLDGFIYQGREDLIAEITARINFADKGLVENYLKYFLAISKKYPRASEEHVLVQSSIEAFDPPTLNAWETEQVTAAMKNSILRLLVTDLLSDKRVEAHLGYIKGSLPVLENFARIEGLI